MRLRWRRRAELARRPLTRCVPPNTPCSVSRLICNSDSYETDLVLDVNTQLYPLGLRERFSLVLTRTLTDEPQDTQPYYDQRKQPTLADQYEYVMHGKVRAAPLRSGTFGGAAHAPACRCLGSRRTPTPPKCMFGGLLWRVVALSSMSFLVFPRRLTCVVQSNSRFVWRPPHAHQGPRTPPRRRQA